MTNYFTSQEDTYEQNFDFKKVFMGTGDGIKGLHLLGKHSPP